MKSLLTAVLFLTASQVMAANVAIQCKAEVDSQVKTCAINVNSEELTEINLSTLENCDLSPYDVVISSETNAVQMNILKEKKSLFGKKKIASVGKQTLPITNFGRIEVNFSRGDGNSSIDCTLSSGSVF